MALAGELTLPAKSGSFTVAKTDLPSNAMLSSLLNIFYSGYPQF